MGHSDARHPIFNRDFRYLWMGNTVSGCGDQFFLVALPWLILQLTGSGAVLGGIMMVQAIPRAALMLIGGAVTDRVSPRKIMILTAATRTVLVAALAAFIWTQHVQIWQVYLLSFLFGVADAFAAPAAQTLLPSLVTPAQLPAANALSQGTQQLAMLAMPAPAGIIIAAFGVASAFSIDAISFLFIIAALLMLRDPPRVESAARHSNVVHSILEGLRYVKNDVALRTLLLVASVLNFCISGPLSVGLAFLAKTEFHSPTAFGLLMSSVAAGSLIGLLFAAARQQRKRGWLLLVVSVIVGICTASIGVLQPIVVALANPACHERQRRLSERAPIGLVPTTRRPRHARPSHERFDVCQPRTHAAVAGRSRSRCPVEPARHVRRSWGLGPCGHVHRSLAASGTRNRLINDSR